MADKKISKLSQTTEMLNKSTDLAHYDKNSFETKGNKKLSLKQLLRSEIHHL